MLTIDLDVVCVGQNDERDDSAYMQIMNSGMLVDRFISEGF